MSIRFRSALVLAALLTPAAFTLNAAPARADGNVQVAINAGGLSPKPVPPMTAGQTVTWTNNTATAYVIVSDASNTDASGAQLPPFDSSRQTSATGDGSYPTGIPQGKAWSFTFDIPGTYKYKAKNYSTNAALNGEIDVTGTAVTSSTTTTSTTAPSTSTTTGTSGTGTVTTGTSGSSPVTSTPPSGYTSRVRTRCGRRCQNQAAKAANGSNSGSGAVPVSTTTPTTRPPKAPKAQKVVTPKPSKTAVSVPTGSAPVTGGNVGAGIVPAWNDPTDSGPAPARVAAPDGGTSTPSTGLASAPGPKSSSSSSLVLLGGAGCGLALLVGGGWLWRRRANRYWAA